MVVSRIRPAVAVDGGRLHGCDLMLAEAFADQVEPGGERGVAKGPAALARERGDGWLRSGIFPDLRSRPGPWQALPRARQSYRWSAA